MQNNTGGNGGAVYPRWSGSRTHIVNSVLRQNHAANATGWGGAVLTWDGAVAVIENSQLIGNTAIEGGAIYNTGNSDITLLRSVVSENTASKWGGAIVNNQHMLIQNSTIAGNTGTDQGGGIVTYGPLTVERSTLISNTTAGRGGAIYMETGGNGPVTIENSTLAGNHADNHGGAIYKASGALSHAWNSMCPCRA